MRELLGLRPSYNTSELEKPFVCFRLAPDLSHPFVAQQFRDARFGVSRILYGAPTEYTPLPAHEPLGLPPAVTRTLPPAPEPSTLVIPPPPPPPLTEVPKNSTEREWIIREIDELYIQKKGFTRDKISPSKPKLIDMTSDILFQLREHMKSLPDAPKTGDLV
jgi:hypothetical protein